MRRRRDGNAATRSGSADGVLSRGSLRQRSGSGACDSSRYIAAGARVIETNTFGANAARLSRFGFENRVSEFNRAAAKLAKETAAGKDVSVGAVSDRLGSASPERTQMYDVKPGTATICLPILREIKMC